MGHSEQPLTPAPDAPPAEKGEEGRAVPLHQAGGLPKTAREFLSDAAAIEARPLPPMARGVLYFLVGMMASFLLWASMAELDKIVTARGKLVTATGTLVVQPLETAVVKSIEVRTGQVVKKGTILVTFDPTFTSADVNQLQSRLNGLQAKVLRCQAELEGAPLPPMLTQEGRLQEQLYEERKNHYSARIQQFASSVSRLEAAMVSNHQDRKNLDKRMENIHEILGMYEELKKKESGSLLKVLEMRDMFLTAIRDKDQAENRSQELMQEVAAVQSERDAFMREWREKAMEEWVVARQELEAVRDQLSKAQRKSELLNLTAPEDAVVLDIPKRSLGSVVREAEPLFTLVPLNGILEAEVEVESADIGLLRMGDAARLKLDAFPFQKHGTLDGVLKTLSQDAYTRQPSANHPEGNEAYYVGRLDLGTFHLKGIPAHTRLLPGMTLTAEIVVGKRTVLSYFLYPIIRTLDEGLREP